MLARVWRKGNPLARRCLEIKMEKITREAGKEKKRGREGAREEGREGGREEDQSVPPTRGM